MHEPPAIKQLLNKEIEAFQQHKLNLEHPCHNQAVESCVLSGHNGSADIRFPRATTRLMSWPDGERYSFPQQSLVVSLLLSLVCTLLFSRTGGILPYLNSSSYTGWANKMLPLFNHTQVFKCEFIQNFYSKICDKKH